MKNDMKISLQKDESIESLLVAAGFDFAVVDRCPDSDCHLCNHSELSAAA